MVAHFVRNINSYLPGGWERTLPYGGRPVCRQAGWSSIVRSKGRKASSPSQTESHVEQVAMDNESEGVYVRVVMDNLPTLARSPIKDRWQAPKGEGLRAIQSSGVWYPLARRPGAKHHPKATQNGHSERSNPTVALRLCRSRRPGRKRCREGWPKKLMPGVMPRIC